MVSRDRVRVMYNDTDSIFYVNPTPIDYKRRSRAGFDPSNQNTSVHTRSRVFICREAQTCQNPRVPCVPLFFASVSTHTLKSSHKTTTRPGEEEQQKIIHQVSGLHQIIKIIGLPSGMFSYPSWPYFDPWMSHGSLYHTGLFSTQEIMSATYILKFTLVMLLMEVKITCHKLYIKIASFGHANCWKT
jgi:hypothetical protein